MRTYAFIDASNLFYGGEKSLGWKIDYLKLIKYLKKKYGVVRVYYFGGVETHGYEYDYLKNETVPIEKLESKLVKYIKAEGKRLDEAKLLKPVKLYYQNDGSTQRKANCDVEMAFYLMREKNNFDRVLVLSGDGDFLPVLKYLRKIGKEVIILARGERTAKEIRRLAGNDFRDFNYLREQLKFVEKK